MSQSTADGQLSIQKEPELLARLPESNERNALSFEKSKNDKRFHKRDLRLEKVSKNFRKSHSTSIMRVPLKLIRI